MRFDVITLMPELISSIIKTGIVARAAKRNLIELHCWNPRDYTEDIHKTVDDRPYGGGPGMVMKADCLLKTIRSVRNEVPTNTKLVYLSPQGKRLKQAMLKDVASNSESIILLCGRYEGVDERVIQLEVDEEWSLGDYVLSGGELGAMVVIDGITRLLPNALGHHESAEQDSFSDNLLDHQHYTRPESIEGLAIPDILKSGNHKAIARWRRKQALGRTYTRRADLIEHDTLSDSDKNLLSEYLKENTSF